MECQTKFIGDISEQMIIIAFLKHGWYPLIPVGDNLRYDIVADIDGDLKKIQCKTGRLEDGKIEFPVCSSHNHVNRGKRDYHGDCDYIACFCPETNGVYVIAIDEVGNSSCTLRVERPKNNQIKGVKNAEDYRIM